MIEYPVDKDSLWAEYSLGQLAVTVRGQKWKVADGTERIGLDADTVMLRHVYGESPTPEPGVNKVVALPEVVDIENNELRVDYELVPLSAEEAATEARAAQRKAMRGQWDALPAHIRGPYQHNFEAANILLDAGDDDAAAELIDAVEPTAKIAGDASLLAQFGAVKAAFYDSITNLTGA